MTQQEARFEEDWQRLKHHVDAALHRGGDTLTLEDVHARILSGQYIFWPGVGSVMVTQVCPRGEFNVLLAGGTLSELEIMLPSIERFAVALGCHLVTVLGRLGWERSFLTRKAGYEAVATLYGRTLGVPLAERGSIDREDSRD